MNAGKQLNLRHFLAQVVIDTGGVFLSDIQAKGLQPVADERKLELVIVNNEDPGRGALDQRHDACCNRAPVKAITLMTVGHGVSSYASRCCTTQACCSTEEPTQII